MLVSVHVLAESKGQIHVHVPNASECLYMSVTSRRGQVMFSLRQKHGEVLVMNR